ncbi:MAG: hypothetical protein WCT77_01940 [Bacteroidota bacterium]|jgi:hypothetical protein
MNIKFVKIPEVRSFTLFGGIPELKTNIIKENKIYFDISFHTKTRLSLSIQSGTVTFRLNEHSEYSLANNLTFVEEKSWSYFHGQQTVNNYFKLTKKQNMQVLKNHILSLTEKLFIDLHLNELVNKDTFEIEVRTPIELLNNNKE